jgi:thiamine kinase-like enzyme
MASCSLDLENPQFFQIISSFLQTIESAANINPRELIYTPLKGGRSKASLFRFTCAERDYVLRLFAQDASHPARIQQIQIAQQACAIGAGPKVFFVDAQLNGLIMEFIQGRTAQANDFNDLNQLAQFAKFLKHLHQSQEPFPVACSPFQRFRNFLLKGEQKKINYPSRFREVKTLMHNLEILLQKYPVSLVPTHLDLAPSNIMLTKENFSLVDWVNGGMSDPYFDLATFTVFQCLNETQISTFLTHYFARTPTDWEWHRFIITQPIRLFVIASAFLPLASKENSSTFYDTALDSSELGNIEDFIWERVAAEMNLPHWRIGLIMLKTGLKLIDTIKFKEAFQYFALHGKIKIL